MKRRSRAGSKPAKARPRKALTAKGRKASKAVTRRGSSPGAHAEVARLSRERDEALEQQAANAWVAVSAEGNHERDHGRDDYRRNIHRGCVGPR
jgi:hypothetical protein